MSQEIVEAEVVANASGNASAGVASRLALIAGMLLLGVVTIGVFAVAPGIGVLMGVVFVVAAFAATKGLQDAGPSAPDQQTLAQAYASPVGNELAAKSTSVIVQIFKALGIVMLLVLAAIIALGTFCAICIAVLSSM